MNFEYFSLNETSHFAMHKEENRLLTIAYIFIFYYLYAIIMICIFNKKWKLRIAFNSITSVFIYNEQFSLL